MSTKKTKEPKAETIKTVNISPAQKNYNHIRNWFLSFIPLGIAGVLFVLCFIFESMLWLYVACTAVFAIFVICFTCAQKTMPSIDGYTLVQALLFFKACKKRGVLPNGALTKTGNTLMKVASQYDFSKSLTKNQVVQLYRNGEKLADQINQIRKKGGQ